MKEVASRLQISVKTAESHRNNLGRKLGRPNRAQMFAFAITHRLVDTSQPELRA
jgi:DNA-binding NarL/FixJ family response regulator